MENKNESQVVNSDEFFSFIDEKFNEVASEATVEELAEFAFGSLEEAMQAFKDSNT